MRKLLLLIICLFYGSTLTLNAQTAPLQEREKEWNSYALPQTNFTRQVAPEQAVIFRVPADWKQQGTTLVFVGPHEAQLAITPSMVPEGYPLTAYVASVLKATADQLGFSEGIITRRTQFQDLEAREILIDSPDTEGKMFRTVTWLTISGPLVLRVSLFVPLEHATALEPFLKAIVQSVMFVPKNFAEFQSARLAAFRTLAPGPIHEIENIVASLNQLDTDREAAINRLTALFMSQPETAVDLLADRRVAVRSAAAEALVHSKNAALKPFLWYVLGDSDPFVAEAAARRLGQENDIVGEFLARSPMINGTEMAARIWPFMSKENRAKFLQGVFSQRVPDTKAQMGALTLLRMMPAAEFKLPLARIMAANDDSMTTVALRVANDRGEALPVDSLMKLAASTNQQIKLTAIESLGHSAEVSDIPRLEALMPKSADPATTASDHQKASAERKALEQEITLSIKKIRFRNELTLAKGAEAAREIIRKASFDPTLAEFVWRYDCEMSDQGCSPAPARNLPAEFKIKSFAENILPRKVTHYTAIPNPAQTLQRFYETLHGLQLDSARAQANLILVMGGLRQKLGEELGVPPDAPALLDYTGINAHSPIVMSSWTAPGAYDCVALTTRRAIFLRVKDRERFERLMETFVDTNGSYFYFTDYFAMATRAAAALPAILPLSAQLVVNAGAEKPDAVPRLSYSRVGQTEWNGIPIKTIERYTIDSKSNLGAAITYLAFVGDVAIVAYDVPTIRELLSNATTAEQQLLAGNEEFRRAAGTDADVVYFSDLNAVFGDTNDETLPGVKVANESGALKFSSASWENSHRLVFDESDWSKPLVPFHPKELSAPRDLLPSSTLAYFLLKLDAGAAWQTWPKNMNFRESKIELDPSLWSMDFSKEVLPELGPECGVALLDLTGIDSFDGQTWAAFCKLKSTKLADALATGKLFRGVGPTTEAAEIKHAETSYFVAVKNGFLVLSNNGKGVSVLGGKTNLAATRDYSRAAEKAPAGIVAFGGYNLEAAIAAASTTSREGLRALKAEMIFSVATAFHSQNFYATASAGTIEGHSSVAMDREGRYAVADFSYLPRAANITFATIEPHGMPIFDQQRLSNIVLKVRAKAPGPIDSIRDDVNSATQKVEQKSPNELLVNVAARRNSPDQKIQLPVTNAEVAAFLKATGEISSDDKNVIAQAREIAGDDRDAWSVAQKLGDWTHKNLVWKSVARAGAAETLATREADCSEFSQLYVAMARSLGLPARIVSGLAYSGSSFGGHAWVEVWIGEWIELDPTWGTHFVDATHVRNEADTLVTAAALNLIDVEIVETRRTVAEFQKSAEALTEHLMKAIPAADKSDLEAAIDPATLTDEFMGANAWNGLNERERDLMSSAYRRVLQTIVGAYQSGRYVDGLHLLELDEKGDRAEVLLFNSPDDELLRLRLLRRDDAWYLVEAINPPGLQLTGEIFGPIVKSIEASRAGKPAPPSAISEYGMVLTLLDADKGEKALELIDRVLQTKPKDQSFRYLKTRALFMTEEVEEGEEGEYGRLLRELSNEEPAYAQAVYELAYYLFDTKPDEAIEFFKRYVALEPLDPRGYRELGELYENKKETALAEASYRKSIAVDPFEIPGYISLATFLIRNGRVNEVGAVLLASDKYVRGDEDVLYNILNEMEDEIKLADAERLAAAEAARMKTSAWANLALADVYLREKRYAAELTFIKRAAEIDPKLSTPHVAMSRAYLKQSRFSEALKAVDHALTLDQEDAVAHFRRATVLARLGRRKEAMAALNRSIEIDADIVTYIEDEENFKSLRTLPVFKKLVADAKKPAEAPAPQ